MEKIFKNIMLLVCSVSLGYLAYEKYQEKQGTKEKSEEMVSVSVGRSQYESNPSHLGKELHNPKPPYPAELMAKGINGTVRLRVTVEADGKPSNVEVVSATHPLFAQSAEKTVREQYTFIPGRRNGQPVRSDYSFTMRFVAP